MRHSRPRDASASLWKISCRACMRNVVYFARNLISCVAQARAAESFECVSKASQQDKRLVFIVVPVFLPQKLCVPFNFVTFCGSQTHIN